jgi:hypothetical protein
VEYPKTRRVRLTRRAFLATSAALLGPGVGLVYVASAQAHPNVLTTPVPGVRQNDDQITTQDARGGPGAVAPATDTQTDAALRAAEKARVAAADQAAEQARVAATASGPQSLRAMVYLGVPDPDVPTSIRAEPTTLSNLIREPGQPWRLRGSLVEVVNHGVLVDGDPTTGKLKGVPMGNAETTSPDGFQFSPRSGGELGPENESLKGAENSRVREAGRFGEVNAYYYADRVLSLANSLRAELGAPPLPFLRVVVNAHPGSRLPGYRENDGETEDGKLRPFPGGHYRLPNSLKTEGRFLHPVEEMNPTGEVHLGPGRSYISDSRDRDIMVDGRKYVRNASHVPGIIAHEVGHHVNVHTADFMCNRLRKPNEYDNQKLHMDEGTADYWAAVVLETPDIYNWQHAAEGLKDRDNRDLRGRRTTDDYDPSDEHRNGNIWSSALWDTRAALGTHETDLLVMKMLLLFATTGTAGASERVIQEQMEQKDEMRDGLAMMLKADEALNQGKNRAQLLKIFDKRGIDLKTPDKKFNRD